LLLSTVFALPALAQIEEVVVTAQKKTEDVQTVPIAVTAFTAQELHSGQIDQTKDLQFHAPNVTYTAGAFGGADFQIRGIGVTAVGYDAESGVAVNFDEVYLAAPQLLESSFYDLGGLEILAGPQSTLYGRGASAGAVNINIAKPNLSEASAEVVASYGNYDATKLEGAVNLPIVTDQLAVRIAGEWDKRDGFITDTYNDTHLDSLDQYSVRSTVRWQPTEKTTIDITGAFQKEDDSHMRADKELCTNDPTGVLGCLPTSAGDQAVNVNATFGLIGSSQQALGAFLGPVAGDLLGLYNLAAPLPAVPAGFAQGARQTSTDVMPVWNSQDNFLSAKWHQQIVGWLDSTLILGYDHNSYFGTQSYYNAPGTPLPRNTTPGFNTTFGVPNNCVPSFFGSPSLDCAQEVFPEALYSTAVGAGFSPAQAAAYVGNFLPYLSTPGELPISRTSNFGITGNNYYFNNTADAFDQSDGATDQFSMEARFATSFEGPINAMLGVYYLHTHTTGDYYVNATTLDYPGIVLGAFGGLADPACYATGCILSPSYYHNYGQTDELNSRSIFGEVYYDAIPDTLKFTVGLRYTDDVKYQSGRLMFFTGGYVPIGTTSEITGIPATTQPYDITDQAFRAMSGRAVVDWTPKLDFTDQTLVYASYARGYKAGGANPGIEPGLGVPATYNPEFIDAYEVGSKNMLLGNSLQANGDVYYYNYTGLQVAATINNTAVNDNINAHVWGAEGNFLWQPSERWQFGLNIAHEESQIIGTRLLDPANPTGGNQDTVLIKDDTISATEGQNCVLYTIAGTPVTSTQLTALQSIMNFVTPNGGVHALASPAMGNIPNAGFGSCNSGNASENAALAAAGLSWGNTALGQYASGQEVSLNGNQLQNTPQLAAGLTGQYTQPLPGDYNLVARLDYHWQSHMWGRIYHDGAAFIGSEDLMNASLQLNSPDDIWFAQAYIKNIFDRNNITGLGSASQTSGDFTGVFYGDPRTCSITIGAKLN
jgi:iron complex outermembrane recepter protein